MTSADAPPHPPVGLKGNSHTNWVGFPPISVGVDGYLAGWPIMWLKTMPTWLPWTTGARKQRRTK